LASAAVAEGAESNNSRIRNVAGVVFASKARS
jgi:hypothetical protein